MNAIFTGVFYNAMDQISKKLVSLIKKKIKSRDICKKTVKNDYLHNIFIFKSKLFVLLKIRHFDKKPVEVYFWIFNVIFSSFLYCLLY